MRTSFISTVIIIFSFLILNHASGQQSSLSLTSSGGTLNYIKYGLKKNIIHGTNYTQGYLGIGTSKAYQMLHVAGGNILLTRNGGNPACLNGSLLFGGAYDSINAPAGEWGIEYQNDPNNQSAPIGLNFWKPYPSSNYGSYFLFLKNDGKVGIGTGTPATKLDVNGDVTIETLQNRDNKVLTTDATGKLILVAPGTGIGDNMGNCEATRNIKLDNYLIVGSGKKENRYSPDGEPWNEGLKFRENTSGQMLLNSFSKSSFILGSLITDSSPVEDGDSRYWASNTKSGGIGFGLYNTIIHDTLKIYGGIFTNVNMPTLRMAFSNDGLVGIGVLPTDNSPYLLSVAGKVRATEVLVQLQSEWRDYVFKPDYNLLSLNDLKTFISNNGHLPEIPDAETVKNNGINLGEMNALLLQKIEELTLYIIDQQKQIDELKNYIQK